MLNKNLSKKGFTLVELLVVIAVLGTLSTMVIIRFTGSQERARDTRRQSDLKQYQTALEIYATKNQSIYPVANSDANQICATLAISGCPSDMNAGGTWPDYHYVSNVSGTQYVLWGKMERTDEYFILCSDGLAGISATQPTNSNCPL